jgi:hypothetical protein
MTTTPEDIAATFAAEADHARDVAERMADPSLKQKWLRIAASYCALDDGSLTARDLGILNRDK